MPYSSNRDRPVTELELSKAPWPAPPLNLFYTSGFQRGVLNLTWDDPTEIAINSRFQILGVNLYRSFDSEFGPYQRVTDTLVGSRCWQDRTDNELVVEEDVTGRFVLFGDCSGVGSAGPRYVFKTEHWPIIKEGSQMINADSGDDIRVYVDGRPARVLNVWGSTGEIEIDPFTYVDVNKQAWDPSVVPLPQSTVTCTYRYTRQLIKTNLFQRVFYRATTVGIPIDKDLSLAQPQDLVETPLEYATATNSMEIEKRDYIWREAIRRNRWMLEQGGERVKVFIQKNVGIPCPNAPDGFHGQAYNDCHLCYGTGIVGGFDGPFEIIITPEDAERRIAQKEQGRTVEHTYEVWTGPAPILQMRDVLVKLNGDRYSVGSVRFPSNRGMLLQQHFTIGHIDEPDIRYQIPVHNPTKYVATQFAPSGPEQEADTSITNNPNIPEERQLRGRTPAWKNTTY